MTTGELIWGDEGWPGPDFPQNAKRAVENSQLRRNVRKATGTIRQRRAGLVAETPDWQELRHAGAAIKDEVLHHLDAYLDEFERNATARGAHVHWARDADEATQTVTKIVQQTGHTEPEPHRRAGAPPQPGRDQADLQRQHARRATRPDR